MKIKVLYSLKKFLYNGPAQFKPVLFKGQLHMRAHARTHKHTGTLFSHEKKENPAIFNKIIGS